jgi:4-amino-4-deoxy-L-arabinose transferase-like glycosyltransferase
VTYSTLAERLVTGHGLTFPTGWYPWIQADAPQSYFSASMSLLLAGVYFVVGYQPLVARLAMAMLSTLAVAQIGLLADRLFGRKVAIVAGLIAAVYAYLIFYGVTLVTETPFIVSVLAGLILTYRVLDNPAPRNWVLLGIALALATLFRMAIIFFVVPMLVWLVWRQRQHWRRALIPLAIIALAILPFTIHNYLIWGRFLLLESQFGHVFWNGNHPGHLGNFHPFKVFPIPPEVLASHNDVEITNRLLQMAVQNILNDPGMFVMLTITRMREYIVFWPTPSSEPQANLLRMLSWGVLVPFALAGLALARKHWSQAMPIFLFIALHTFVHAVSWTMPRYRLPVDAVLIPFGALALVSLVTWATSRVRVAPAQRSWQALPTSEAGASTGRVW